LLPIFGLKVKVLAFWRLEDSGLTLAPQAPDRVSEAFLGRHAFSPSFFLLIGLGQEMASNITVVLCPPHSSLSPLDNLTCICGQGFAPPGLCFFDSGYAQTDAYAAYLYFFVVVFTSLAVVSLYEVLYALYRKDFRLQMFYPSRGVTFFLGVG
jgi:hypothetical protein